MNSEIVKPAAVRARILKDDRDRPIQLVVSAGVAADLAFIAEDFAMQVVANDDDDVERLIRTAEIVAVRLRDCLAARGGEDATGEEATGQGATGQGATGQGATGQGAAGDDGPTD